MCCAERKVKDMSKPILMQFPLKGSGIPLILLGQKSQVMARIDMERVMLMILYKLTGREKGGLPIRVSMMQYLIKELP